VDVTLNLTSRAASIAVAAIVTLHPASDQEPKSPPGLNGAACRTTVTSVTRPAQERVNWVLARDAAMRKVLATLCGTVGPSVVEQTIDAHDAMQADSIAILTWNTHVGGGDIGQLVQDLRTGNLTGGTPVHDFVLLLQEVYRGGGEIPTTLFGVPVPSRIAIIPASHKRIDVVHAANDVALNLFYAPSMRNGPSRLEPEDRGNAILSTLRLYGLNAIELPIELQRRVALVATVQGTTTAGVPWQLELANAHLDTRSGVMHGLRSLGGGRRAQAQALLDALPPAGAQLLAGDMNTWGLSFTESAVEYLRTQFPQTPLDSIGSTFQAGPFGRRLDWMFFRMPQGWSAHYTKLDSRYGSDHYPLLAWVRVTPNSLQRPGTPSAR
jgi:endonuclease/exonuclease/phosphatase family metal-dependent hydrolase